MPISFLDYAGLGRPQWRGELAPSKSLYFLLLGAPDVHARIRNGHVLNQIAALPLPDKARVLELGSARGLALFWLARHHREWQLTGIDLEEEWVAISERAARKGGFHNLNFRCGPAEELAERESYDLILCIDVLEHIADDAGLLRQMKEALKPGGYLVLHVPRRRHEQWRWLSTFRAHEVEGHVREEYQEQELRQLLSAAGYVLVNLRETFGRWGEVAFELNMMGWKRWRLRTLMALLTYLPSLLLGFQDVRHVWGRGNAFLAVALAAGGETGS
jgi:SAM-dependent methyltransferase